MQLGPKELQNICTLVGQIIVPFAIMEASLNAIVETVYQYRGGNSLAKELPGAFGHRIAYLKKCLLKLPALANIDDEFRALLDADSADSKIRNIVTDGYVADFESEHGILTFKQLETITSKPKHTEQTSRYSTHQLIECGGRIMTQSAAMNAWAYRILNMTLA